MSPWEPSTPPGPGDPAGVGPGASGVDGDDPPEDPLVRPFVITGGRTRHATTHLRVETLVARTDVPSPAGLQFEHAAILERCGTPISVAEVAARVGVPLGVAQILVGDLADAGLVAVHEADTAGATPDLLKRMIDAVRAL